MATQTERAAARSKRETEALMRNKGFERTRHGARVLLPIQDGCAFVVTDQHYMPGMEPSRSHRASVILAKRLKPFALIANGDAIDGASISRWPASSFTDSSGRPTVLAELNESAARLKDYERLSSIKFLIWNMGNHDARFETRLAEKVPEYAGVNGFTLKEHFPGWLPAWRTDFVNQRSATHSGSTPGDSSYDVQVIVKHRYKGGMYAGQNNALWAGTSIVTGHDHMLKAMAITTGGQLRWGIHAGTMAPIDSPQFTHYTEDNPMNWQEGFAILHFKGGRFIGPELVHVTPDGRVLFRGEVVKV